jgi:peptidoglycan/LPS O-acetylase OafA/YrhL
VTTGNDQPGSLRIMELDALRGLAALAVVAFHFTGHFDRLYGHKGPLPFTFDVGNYGAHLFFVISGFVIFMTLERTQHILDFIVSRISRLFPAYWVALCVTLVAVQTVGLPGQHVTTRDALINLTMMADFFNAHEVDGSYWTLQIELFFYLQMIVWYAVGAFSRVRVMVVCWLVLAFAYGIEARLGVQLSYTLRELLIVRFIPFFAAGVLMYRVYQRCDKAWVSGALLAACVLGVWSLWSWVEAAVLTVCIGLFFLFIFGKLRMLAHRSFVFLGTVSYTLYLLHQSIGFILIAHLEAAGVPPLVSVAATSVVMLGLASVLTFTVEKPARRAIRQAYKRWWQRLVIPSQGPA